MKRNVIYEAASTYFTKFAASVIILNVNDFLKIFFYESRCARFENRWPSAFSVYNIVPVTQLWWTRETCVYLLVNASGIRRRIQIMWPVLYAYRKKNLVRTAQFRLRNVPCTVCRTRVVFFF